MPVTAKELTIPTTALSKGPACPAGRRTDDPLTALIVDSLDADKAEGIVVIDLTGKTPIADTMVVASGRSSRHVGAMASHLMEKLRKREHRVTIEGKTTCDWVLLDAGAVVVHLFRPEVRAFYNLEKMWRVPAPRHTEESSPLSGM